MAKKSTVETVAGTVKPPISFKEFAKEPVKGLMFICIIAVGYLYVDIKMTNSATQKQLNEKITVLEVKVDQLTDQLRKSDSTLSAAASSFTSMLSAIFSL